MQVQISKWGNSLGLRLPRSLASQIGVSEGAKVEITAEGDRLVIAAAKPGYRLDDLLVGMTPAAAHEAFRWGPDIGREVIDE
jgi:antitoxin MazE